MININHMAMHAATLHCLAFWYISVNQCTHVTSIQITIPEDVGCLLDAYG